MEFVRRITTGQELSKAFALPSEMLNRKLEIIILPLDEAAKPATEKKSLRGCWAKYANPELIPLEEGAWGRAIEDDYA